MILRSAFVSSLSVFNVFIAYFAHYLPDLVSIPPVRVLAPTFLLKWCTPLHDVGDNRAWLLYYSC